MVLVSKIIPEIIEKHLNFLVLNSILINHEITMKYDNF